MFYEGKPCITCGGTTRYANGNSCVVCAKNRSRAQTRKQNKGVWKHRLSQIDIDAKTAVCAKCGPVSVKQKQATWRCKNGIKATNGYIKAAVRTIKTRTKKPRKIGPCEICTKEKPLCWDHDHKTGQHRGWLCHFCNVGIGFFFDDPVLLQSAIKYLGARDC